MTKRDRYAQLLATNRRASADKVLETAETLERLRQSGLRMHRYNLAAPFSSVPRAAKSRVKLRFMMTEDA